MRTVVASRQNRYPCAGLLVLRQALAFLLALAVAGVTHAAAFAKAAKTPDPVAAEAKLRKLGVGEHVMVKLASGKKVRGHITAIGDHSFTLKADRTNSECQIAYDDIVHVKKNPGPVFWMAVGAIIVIVILAVT